MLVLSIDEATTDHILLHIDEVEFDHTRYIAIVLLLLGAVFGGQLQEHTRGERHLVVALTLVTVATGGVRRLIAVVSLVVFRHATTVHILITEAYVAGQVAKVIHETVDTEVVAMRCIIASVVRPDGMLLVE